MYKYALGVLECLPVGVESGNENQREQIWTYIKKKISKTRQGWFNDLRGMVNPPLSWR